MGQSGGDEVCILPEPTLNFLLVFFHEAVTHRTSSYLSYNDEAIPLLKVMKSVQLRRLWVQENLREAQSWPGKPY